jgi:O-antigen/teichoic acid export membrane protein
MAGLMRSRLFLRRSTAAAGIYSSAVLGFLATVIAAHRFSTTTFGLYALVIAATGFFQGLLDLTVEEALVKYGFRYVTREEWGRLRGLFRGSLVFKLVGAALASLALLGLAPVADSLFNKHGLGTPLAIAALLPLAQFPEGTAGVALVLRERYDLRGAFLFLSMALRLTAVALSLLWWSVARF